MKTTANRPTTPEEWQEHVNVAAFLLGHVGARRLMSFTTPPDPSDLCRVDAPKCHRILLAGSKKGYQPLPFEELVKLYA